MRKASVPVAFLFALILAVPTFSQSATPSPGTVAESISSEVLLQRAHSMLASLSTSDRLRVLSQLLNASYRKYPKDARAWIDEAFALASQLSDRNSRVDFQVQLLMPLSAMDNAAALDRLAAIDPPLHPGDDDPREAAATWIFGDFYRSHPAEVERIITVARHLGDTGTYPFGGVSNVVSELLVRNANIQPVSKEKQEAAAVLIQDAVQYFKKSPASRYLNEQLTDFLKSYAQFMPTELLKPALEELVGRLQQAPQSTGPRLITMVSGKGENAPIVARNRNDVLLAQLMPAVRAVDPAWEHKLREAPEVNRVAKKLEEREHSGITIEGAYSRGSNEARIIQELQMHRVQMLGQESPEQAVKALNDVSDPALHAAASANLALAIKDANPQESARLLAQAWQTLEKTKPPQDRLAILYQLTHTLASLGLQEQLASAVDQSFAAAGESTSAGLYQLTWIVQTSARFMPRHVLDKINDVRSPRLQAELLIALARALELE